MLQNIRDKSQGWIAWLVVFLLIATFALWGVHAYLTGDSRNTTVLAEVNGQPITQNQVSASYERLRQQQQLQLGADFSLNQAAEAQLKRQALNQLIIANVLIHAANKIGYRVTTGQVDEALLQIPAFQVNGQFSVDRFHEILNSILYSQDQFLADMRHSMLINQVQGGYVSSAFALPNEVALAIRLVNQKRDMSYTIIPAARYAKSVQVSEADIKNYYQAHQSQYQSPEQVSIQYIMLSLPDIAARLHFDKTKLEQYYENNLQTFTQPASWHVAHILVTVSKNVSAPDVAKAQQKINTIAQQLKSGADFSKLAAQYSDDKTSSLHGGELDWFSAGTLDPNFEKAVANLQKVGDISQPVRTPSGFSIIKLLGVRKAQVLPFNTVKSQVRNALAQQQAQQIFADQSDKLSNLTYANPSTLDIAAKALELPIQTTAFFDRQGAKSGVASNPRIINAAFSQDVLQQNNNSDLLTLDANTVVVLRIKQHKPAAVLPFADVQNTIQAQLVHKKAQQQAEALGQTLLKRLQNKQATPVVLAKQFSLPWQVDNKAGRYDARVDATILRQAFQMPRPETMAGTPSVAGIVLPSGDYAVIVLNAVHDGELPAVDSTQRRIFTEQIENNLGRIDYELYVRELTQQAKVKFKQNASTADLASVNQSF